ncbi:MAG: CDGSH iron-sulfur domain-containing protein [bacterium]
MRTVTKKYSNGEVTVVWKSGECIHSRICIEKATGLPEVFNPREVPWINMEGAGTKRIIETVKKCPTKALSYFMNHEVEASVENEQKGGSVSPAETVIQVMKNGPILVYGDLVVKNPDGTETRKSKVTAFCRCGASKTNPYCDGSHYDVNFAG